MSARAWIRWSYYALTIVGLAALGYCAVWWATTKLFQAHEASEFRREIRSPVKTKTTPAPPAVLKDGSLVGKLDIPRIGVSVMVVQGVDTGDLNRAVGHIPGTALPGESGNIGLAGHRDTFFRPLSRIRRDDTITLRTAKRTYRYRVVFTKVVAPEDVQVLDPTGRDTLTLVTCFPFHYIGAAPRRFIVRAERLSAPENRPSLSSAVQRKDG